MSVSRAGIAILVLAVGLAAPSSLRAADPGTPISMADPAGQDLVLASLDVRVAAQGPLALVELDMNFRNPQAREVEGRFAITMPPGAAISRFAKDVEGRLQEGEVVERLKAVQVYTKILHSLRDPALLESEPGNTFRARIFPIPAGGTTRILLSYSLTCPAGPDGVRTLRVPLRGLPRIGTFTYMAFCRTAPGETVELEGWLGKSRRLSTGDDVLFQSELVRRDLVPPDDLVLRAAPGRRGGLPGPFRVAVPGFQLLSMRAPAAAALPQPEPASWSWYLDTSASTAPAAELRAATFLATLAAVAATGAPTPGELAAFDLGIEPLASWPRGAPDRARILAALRARLALGPTDLGAVLARIGDEARRSPEPRAFVLATDGIATKGARDPAALVAALGAWPERSRLHVLVLGSAEDAATTRAIAEAGRGRVVRVRLSERAAEHAAEAARELRRPLGRAVRISDPAAAWIEPEVFPDVRPGEELIAFAALREGQTSEPTAAGSGTGEIAWRDPPGDAAAFAPLVEREAYRRLLDRLEREERAAPEADAKAALRARRLAVSLEHRVLCPLTSMLVLETEADYERFGIDRRALKDVLVVTETGIKRMERSWQPPRPKLEPPPPPEPEKKEAAAPAKPALSRDGSPEPAFPPGRDPLIRLLAPPDTRRVVALFPWGETRPMVLDPTSGYWQCRFLVPRDAVHGRYRVVVIVTRGDGRAERLVFSFRADREAPTGRGTGRVAPGPGGWRVDLEVQASPDTERAEARLPDGRTLALVRGADGSTFTGHAELAREAVGTASIRVPVLLLDRGHNRLVLELEVELR